MKRPCRYFSKTPARQGVGIRRPLLNDILPLLAADLLAIRVGRRVNPVDAPRVEGWVVNPQCRPVPVPRYHRHNWSSRATILFPRNHPDILDGPAFENPPEVDLAQPSVRRTVW